MIRERNSSAASPAEQVLTPVEQERARIEARRPKVKEKEFSIMRQVAREFDPNDPLVPGNEDLLYKGKDGKLYVPDFMVEFLQREYGAKWNMYSEWRERAPWTSLSRALYPDGIDPVSAPTSGLKFTTAERMRAEYRREQIKRMRPKEAKQARQEDLKEDSKDLPRTITEVMALAGSDAAGGTAVASTYVSKLREKGYTEAEIEERVAGETSALSKAFAAEANVSEGEKGSLAKKMEGVREAFESALKARKE